MSRSKSIAQAEEWSRLGVSAARNGEFLLARGYLARAIDADRRNPAHRFNLAAVFEQQGALAEAASLYAEALAKAPGTIEAADRLSSLLGRYTLDDNTLLDPAGLKAALAFDRIDRQAVGEAAFARLKQEGTFKDGSAVALLPRKTPELIRNELLLATLATSINKDLDIEHWLAKLRRTLLIETPAERFEDRSLQAVALALASQCVLNEHVWPESEEEGAALAALTIDDAALVDGDPEMGRRLLLHLLYRPLDALLPAGTTEAQLAKLRPKALRELVSEEWQQREAERRAATGLQRIGTIGDATSLRVKAQYEAAPYPRWRSVRLPRPGAILRALGRYVPAERLQRFSTPFDVLLAGCGTGRQALQSAVGYGPHARVTAIDLAAASLGYAARQAAHFGVGNIRFAQADFLALHPAAQQYDVAECVGVLHHMADPMAGLAHLAALVKPGGLAYVGLYSATARTEITALRRDPASPGPGCSNTEARHYRQRLLLSEDRDRFARSKDFYTLSEFRDLALHESEQPLQLADIEAALDRLGLIFLGFTLDPEGEARFAAAYPEDRFPGSLPHWIALESDHPHLFDAMYRFWVAKAA
jgi:ubiquinone/menaquinone biosynthesis C-methylase UbiE